MKYVDVQGRMLGITEDGIVFLENGRKLTQYQDADGYKYVAIRIGTKRKKIFVHRLVAKAYLQTVDYTLQVNHKDGNKTNNCVSNLEWCTCGENQLHSRYALKNQTGFFDVAVRCVETNEEFVSTRAAWRKMGINYCHISECINGKRKSAGGYHWERV